MREYIKKRIEAVRYGEVSEGYAETAAGCIPTDWSGAPLSEISDVLSEQAGDRDFETLSISAGIGFVNQAEKFGKELSGKQYAKYIVLRRGDFAYNKGNSKRYPQGCTYMLRERDEAAVPNVFECFRITQGHPEYYEQLFINGFMNKQLTRKINHGVRDDGLLNLTDDDFYSTIFPVPPLAEQRKIADILATCDQVIELKQQLLEEKRHQKQWLMQKLLDPDSGVRLPGYENSEWYTVTLDEYCDCLDTLRKPVNAQQREKMQGNYPYWGANSIQGYINDYLFDEEIVLLAEDGGCFDDFKTKSIAVYVKEKCWVNNHAHILRAKNGNTKLLYFILVHKDIRNYINGTTRSKLTQGDMMSIAVTLPKSPQEQKRLIEVLTACEKEIELLEQELAVWQQKKKALMQLLLTGLVRVNA